MTRRAAGAACFALLAAAALQADGGWRELRGDGFVLRGALSDRALRAVACDLQTIARAMRPLGDEGARELEVLAVDDARGARQLLPALFEQRGTQPLGAYWAGPHGEHLVVRVDAAPDERRRRILHEYAHVLTHRAHDAPPRWLDEGLAEFWETAKIGPDRIDVGGPVAAHIKALRSKTWIPLADLTSASILPTDARQLTLFYAQSWALVRYLVVKGDPREPFLERMAGPMPTEPELRHFIEQGSGELSIPRTAPASPCGDPEIRPLSPLDGLIVQARALVDGDRPASAVPLLREALRLAPGHPAPLEALGIAYFAQNQPAGAAAAFDEAISGGRGSHLAYYYRAVLAGPVPDLSDGSGRVPVIEYLRRAVSLAPGFAPARALLQELLGKSHLAASPQVWHTATAPGTLWGAVCH